MTRRGWFLLAVLLQVLVLAGMGAVKVYTVRTGTVVRLKIVPVDPRDLFRGDYVALRYEISTLAVQGPYEAGEQVYVVLEPGDAFWTAVGVSRGYPALRPGQVALKGRVRWFFDGRVDVRYGSIEQFFVPEGEGRPLEQQQADLAADVAVDRFGNAAMVRLLLGGREVTFR